MKDSFLGGATGQLVTIFLQDSSSATGAGLTGLTASSAGLKCYYFRSNASSTTAVTLVSGTLGTYSSGLFQQIDATNMPGYYQFGIPAAAIAAMGSAGSEVTFNFSGATNLLPTPYKIRISAISPDTAWAPNVAAGANGGIPLVGSQIPNANAGANGGLPTGDSSGRVTLIPSQSPIVHSGTAQAGGSNTITLATTAIAIDDIYKGALVTCYSGTGSGQSRTVISYVGSTKVATIYPNWTVNPDTTTLYAIDGEYLPKIDATNLGVITTTNSDKTGYSLSQSFPSNFASLAIDTLGRIASVTGSVGSVSAGVTVTTNNDKTGYSLSQVFPSNFSSLAITSLGQVSASGVSTLGNVTIGGYAAGQDPLSLLTTDSTKFAGANIANLNATISSRMATFTLPTNFANFAIDAAGRIAAVTGSVGSVSTGVVVTTNNDKIGYSLSQAFPPNFAALAIDSIGRVSASGATILGSVIVGGYSSGQDPLSLLTTDSTKFAGANIDATISSRSSATNLSTLQTTVNSINTATSTYLDATVSSRMATFTLPTRFSSLAIDSSGNVSTLTSGDSPGVTTLLSRLTNTRAGYLDNLTNLDANISSRMSTFTLPNNFSALAIDSIGRLAAVTGSVGSVNGAVTVTTITDKSGYSLTSSERTSIASAIWDELTSSSTTSGSFGTLLKNNLDVQISSIKAKTDQLTFSGGSVVSTLNGELVGLSNTALSAISDQIYGYVVDGTWTLHDCFKIVNSILAGISKVNGNVITFRDIANTKNRVTAVVDSSGQRISITYDRS